MSRRADRRALPRCLLLLAGLLACLPLPLSAQSDAVLEVLEAFHRDGQFDGAALVYRDGKRIVPQGFGQASIEKGVANTPEARFDIASITKAFTATLYQTRS